MHPEEDHQQEENEEDHLILYGDQVSGKSPKFLSKDSKKLYKGMIQEEHAFFERIASYSITDPQYKFIKFLP